MAIIGTLPNTIANGQLVDATPVMADFNFIVSQVNANAQPLGTIPPGTLLAIQVFAGSGTYFPVTGMGKCVIRAQGGGGAGTGSSGAGAGNVSAGAPGANGTYAEGQFTAAQIGASKVVTIGAGGIGVAGAAGNNGGDTSVGALLIAPGGPGGGATITNAVTPLVVGNGSQSNPATGAYLSSVGVAQEFSQAHTGALIAIGGSGGQSVFGPGARAVGINSNGNAGVAYGSGGSGTVVNQAGGTATGGNGAPGIVVIFEYS